MLRSGEAKIIAVVVPDLDNPFFTSVVSAVEQCLGPEAYEVIVASSHGEEDAEVQAEGNSGMASGGTGGPFRAQTPFRAGPWFRPPRPPTSSPIGGLAI